MPRMIFLLLWLCEQHATNKFFLICLLNTAIFCQLRASHLVYFSPCQQHGRAESFAVFKSNDASLTKTAGRLHMTCLVVAGESKSKISITSEQPRNTYQASPCLNDLVKNELWLKPWLTLIQ